MEPLNRGEWLFDLRKVWKAFGKSVALAEIDLQIARGESLFLYGPNGAGKTTLLRLLGALARPTEGTILWQGRELSENLARLKRSVGFFSHATYLYEDLTARENLHFFANLYQLPQAASRVEECLEMFSLGRRWREPVRSLSRGLQRRVSLARVFLHNPECLLLDEPFTELDSRTVSELVEILARARNEGRTLVFSMHDFERGATLARRLLVLDRGRVVHDGAVDPARALSGQPAERGAR